MDLSYKQEITVGGLVIVAILLFIVGTTWLGGGSIGGDTDEFWKIQFQNVGGLKASSSVRISGVAVGRVEEVRLVEAGKVLVFVSLDENIVPKTDARAEVASVGFVGDAVIDFHPGSASTPLPRGQVIAGTQASGLTGMAQGLAGRADSVLIGLQAIASPRTADELVATMRAMQGTLKAMQRTMDVYGNPNQGPTAALTETMVAFQRLTARLDSTLANPALASTFRRMDTLTANLAAATGRFDSTLAALNRGEGTLGKFARDSSLYQDMRNATQALTNLVNTLQKQPGQISPTIKVCVIPVAC